MNTGDTWPDLSLFHDVLLYHLLVFCWLCMHDHYLYLSLRTHTRFFYSLHIHTHTFITVVFICLYISLACWNINVGTQIFTCQLQSTSVMKEYGHLCLPFCFVKIVSQKAFKGVQKPLNKCCVTCAHCAFSALQTLQLHCWLSCTLRDANTSIRTENKWYLLARNCILQRWCPLAPQHRILDSLLNMYASRLSRVQTTHAELSMACHIIQLFMVVFLETDLNNTPDAGTFVYLAC